MRPLLLLALFLGIVGCDTEGIDVCTLEYRFFLVRVVDASGDPVPGLTARSIVEKTGVVLHDALGASGGVSGERGEYLVAADDHTDLISHRGSIVLFEAKSDDYVATGTFVFESDGCHIMKQSGPEQIVSRRR